MSRYTVFSGFLGSGKTTTMIALAQYLKTEGKKAAILVNDLGASYLVDGRTTFLANCCVSDEITAGCICYQTENLVDKLRRFRDTEKADIIFSDAPGCGIGALDHVYHALNRDYHGEFTLSPFVAVCDPKRLSVIMPEHADIGFPGEMEYLFDAQLKEAEVIVLNKTDLISEEERERCLSFLTESYPEAEVFPVSAKTGEGIGSLADYLMTHESELRNPDLGYGGPDFIAAENCMSWYNRQFALKTKESFDGNQMIVDLTEMIRDKLKQNGRNVPHLKIMAYPPVEEIVNVNAKVSLLGVDEEPEIDIRFDTPQDNLGVIINARATCESRKLDNIMHEATNEIADRYNADLHVFFTECFGMMDEGRL